MHRLDDTRLKTKTKVVPQGTFVVTMLSRN